MEGWEKFSALPPVWKKSLWHVENRLKRSKDRELQRLQWEATAGISERQNGDWDGEALWELRSSQVVDGYWRQTQQNSLDVERNVEIFLWQNLLNQLYKCPSYYPKWITRSVMMSLKCFDIILLHLEEETICYHKCVY
jgi:hypothetical protein